MYPFEAYLKEHNLNPLRVSIVARVRYLTVWNAARGNPITAEQARKIKVAVISLTGHFYAGPLAVFPEEVSIPNHHSHQ